MQYKVNSYPCSMCVNFDFRRYCIVIECDNSCGDGAVRLRIVEASPLLLSECAAGCLTEPCEMSAQLLKLDIAVRELSPSMKITAREEARFRSVLIGGLMSNRSLEAMAEGCYLSLSTFKRRFRQCYSASPHRWLLEQRLNIAYRLIVSTDLSLGALVTLCGFRNTSHFISLFRRRYSVTPMSLRRTAVAENPDAVLAAVREIVITITFVQE